MKNRIKAERAELNLTQAELADKVEVSRQTIISLEKGKDNPSVLIALKLASVFSKSVSDIFSLEDSDWECE